VALRTDTAGNRVVPNRFPLTDDERFYTIARCTTDVPQPGVADLTNSCGSTFDERWNPSNTGNVRLASRFTLADGLVLSVDPSFQYVKANGGGTATGREFAGDILLGAGTVPGFGYIGGSPFYGVDLNGDGDLLDQVRVLAPSRTQTDRYGVIASLRYDLNDAHSVRVAYSYDRARHRQTGETGFLHVNGVGPSFPVNDPIAGLNGHVLQKRDRLSYAILHQIAGEYRGEFFDGSLVVNAACARLSSAAI